MIRFLILIAAVFIVYRAGIYFEDNRIIATCRDTNAVTIIQGERFVCLTEDMVRSMHAQRNQRGA